MPQNKQSCRALMNGLQTMGKKNIEYMGTTGQIRDYSS